MPYFDAASGTPLHPVARQALLAALEDGWADPARLHRESRRARLLLDAARESLAESLAVRRDEVRFTPSGTAALQLGIAGTLAARRRTGRQLAVSAVEHSSVLHAAEAHELAGGTLSTVPVDARGRVLLDAWQQAVAAPGTALACLQSANHEVGTVQPLAEAAAHCRAAGVPLLVDAAQSIGRAPVPEGWSLLAASARKWGGPAGLGVLVVRTGVRFDGPLPGWHGGDVPGGPNLPAAVAAAAGLRAVLAEAEEANSRLSALIERMRARIPETVPDTQVLGDPEHRLPHLLTFSCLYVDGEVLLSGLDRAGYSVSSGSSCTSDTLTPSHVLAAMGAFTGGNVRVSLPSGTTEEEVELFLRVLPGVVAEARGPEAPTSAPLRQAPPTDRQAGGSEYPALVLDTLGRRCPVPIIELAKHLDQVPVGAVIAVLSDDEAARHDVPAWCEMREQEYVGESPAGTYHVRRRS